MKSFTFLFLTKMTTDKKTNAGEKLARAAAIGIGVSAFLLLGFVGCASMVSQSIVRSEQESSGTVAIEDSSWVPEGFTPFNNKIATKWTEVPSEGCYLDGCYAMEVVSSEQCDHLYVELALLDSSGANVGFTNDTTSSLSPGQRAVLVFNASTGEKARIAKVNCF